MCWLILLFNRHTLVLLQYIMLASCINLNGNNICSFSVTLPLLLLFWPPIWFSPIQYHYQIHPLHDVAMLSSCRFFLLLKANPPPLIFTLTKHLFLPNDGKVYQVMMHIKYCTRISSLKGTACLWLYNANWKCLCMLFWLILPFMSNNIYTYYNLIRPIMRLMAFPQTPFSFSMDLPFMLTQITCSQILCMLELFCVNSDRTHVIKLFVGIVWILSLIE